MIRAFWSEVRRSPMRWILPVLLAMSIGMLYWRDTMWIGVWPQASAAVQNPAWFIAPVVAAGAAWSAGRIGRAGAGELLAAGARPAWQRELLQLTTTLLYGLLPLVVCAAIAAAMSVRDAGPGFLWPSYLVLGGSLVTMSTALGHLAGRLTRSLLAAPAAAVAVLLLLVWSGDSLHVLSGPPHLQITFPAILFRAALAVSVVAAAVAVGAFGGEQGWRRPARRAAAVPAATLVAVAITGTVAATPLRVERAAPDPPLCTNAQPIVCVWPEHVKYLPRLAAAAARLDVLSGELEVQVPDRFHERGLDGPVDTDLDGFVLALAGEWLAVRGMVSRVMSLTLPGVPCRAATVAASERRDRARGELREWLVNRAFGGPKPSGFFGGDPPVEAAANRAWELPDAEQIAWAQARLATIWDTPCAD